MNQPVFLLIATLLGLTWLPVVTGASGGKGFLCFEYPGFPDSVLAYALDPDIYIPPERNLPGIPQVQAFINWRVVGRPIRLSPGDVAILGRTLQRAELITSAPRGERLCPTVGFEIHAGDGSSQLAIDLEQNSAILYGQDCLSGGELDGTGLAFAALAEGLFPGVTRHTMSRWWK